MKTKRSLLLIFTLCAALSLTACNGKQPANTEKPQDTQTESSAASSDDSSSELDDLYQQENQLFADQKETSGFTFKSVCTFSISDVLSSDHGCKR